MEKRRLSAIMFTDIVGYSRKMEADEVKMLRLLDDHIGMVEPAAARHEGEIVKRVGDAFLISFDSAVNAVRCALDIQESHRIYNADKSETDQVLLRIGIHLGDIVLREGDVFGDGVNIASRVQPLAEPGCICVTRTVYDLVKKKLDVKALELGPQQLKNIEEAVDVFQLLTGTVGVEMTSSAKLSVAPNRAAVLPLRNLTGREDQKYLCEGMAEDLIFRLSRVKGIHAYPLEDVLSIGEEFRTAKGVRKALGAKYLVRGSLQRFGDSLTIQWEAVNTDDGERIFSERYSGSESDLTKLLSQAARDVLFAVVGRVSGEDEAALAAFSSKSTFANDLYLQARHAQRKVVTWTEQQGVLKQYEAAVTADGNFALARAGLGEAYATIYGTWDKGKTWLDKAKEQAEKAVELAPDLPEAHYALGLAMDKALQKESAEKAYRRAIELRPAYLHALRDLALLCYSFSERRRDEGTALLRCACEVSRSIGDRIGEARALLLHGFCKVMFVISRLPREEYLASLEKIDTALVTFRELGDHLYEATALRYQGNLRAAIDDPSGAVESYQSSLALARKIGSRKIEAQALNSLGWHHKDRDDLEKALESFSASLVINRDIGNRGWEVTNLFSLASLNLELGYYDMAFELRKQESDISREENYPNWEIWYLHWMGGAYSRMGKLHAALEKYQEAWLRSKEEGSAFESNCLRSLGSVKSALGDFPGALEDYNAVLESARQKSDRSLEASILYQLANLHFDREDLQKAKELWEQSRQIFQELGSERAVQWTTVAIGGLLWYQGECQVGYDLIAPIFGKKDIDAYMSRFVSQYLGACEVGLGQVETGLARMQSVLDCHLSRNHVSDIPYVRWILAKSLSDLGRADEAREHLTAGRALAEETGMKNELRRYDALLAKMQQLGV